jgi:hypothetical protein
MTDTTVAPTADDFAANLRASARQAPELIDTLAQSVRGTSLRAGYREPFPWGTSSARDLVALLVKLAAPVGPASLANDDTHTTEQEPTNV